MADEHHLAVVHSALLHDHLRSGHQQTRRPGMFKQKLLRVRRDYQACSLKVPVPLCTLPVPVPLLPPLSAEQAEWQVDGSETGNGAHAVKIMITDLLFNVERVYENLFEFAQAFLSPTRVPYPDKTRYRLTTTASTPALSAKSSKAWGSN